MSGDLTVKPGIVIPLWELQYTTSTSGGPGGQHANRNQTRVTVIWYPGQTSVFSKNEEARQQMLTTLGPYLNTDGSIHVSSSATRSQSQNLSRARDKLAALVLAATRPKKRRKKTSPTHGSKRRRLKAKRLLGEKKRLRRPPKVDD